MKGISSIIATVLVLLVTLTVVSLFSSWAPNLSKDLMDSTGNQSRNRVDCQKAELDVVSAKYRSSDNNTTVVVRNTGTIELNNISVEAWGSDIPINRTFIGTLQPAGLGTKNISTNTEPVSIEIISKQCSNAQDKYEQIE